MVIKAAFAATFAWALAISTLAQPISPVPPAPPKQKAKKMIIIQNGDTTILRGDDMLNDDMDDLKIMLPKLFKNQSPEWNTEGIMGQPGGRNDNKAMLGVLTYRNEKGALIKDVMKGTPAEKAGLKADDIITAINGVAVTSGEELTKEIGKYLPDDKINITYLRNQQTENTSAILIANNKAAGRNYPKDTVEFTIDDFFKTFPPDWKEMAPLPRKLQLGVGIQDTENGKGVKIISVTENSPAALAGIKKDDLLLSVNGTPLTDINDLRKMLNNAKEGDKWKIDYERGNKKNSTELVFPKKLKTADL